VRRSGSSSDEHIDDIVVAEDEQTVVVFGTSARPWAARRVTDARCRITNICALRSATGR
jgi:hypothetical protein